MEQVQHEIDSINAILQKRELAKSKDDSKEREIRVLEFILDVNSPKEAQERCYACYVKGDIVGADACINSKPSKEAKPQPRVKMVTARHALLDKLISLKQKTL